VNIFCIENFFTVQDFWATCTCPEKQSCPELTVLKYFLSFRVFEQVALALEQSLSWTFSSGGEADPRDLPLLGQTSLPISKIDIAYYFSITELCRKLCHMEPVTYLEVIKTGAIRLPFNFSVNNFPPKLPKTLKFGRCKLQIWQMIPNKIISAPWNHEAAFNFSTKTTGQHIPALTDCITTTTPHAHDPSASLGQKDTIHLL